MSSEKSAQVWNDELVRSKMGCEYGSFSMADLLTIGWFARCLAKLINDNGAAHSVPWLKQGFGLGINSIL